jgi:hypothetical protein
MSNVERIRALRTLLFMATAVILMLALQGCAYSPPYPDHVLADADPWIYSVEYLPAEELQATCALRERVLGCGNLTTGIIYVVDDPALSACVLRHERSHFREVFVEKVAYAESATHKHWLDQYCEDNAVAGLQ